MQKAKNPESESNGPALGFEAQLWAAADKMRGHMDASEYRNEPYTSRVFDPCGGSGPALAEFVQSDKFVEEHGGRVGDIAVYGQDKSVRGQRRFGLPQEARRVSTRRRTNQSNFTTWKLARVNLAIRDFSLSASKGERVGVRCRIPRNADSFRQDLHPDLKANLVPVRKDLANPPFNMSDWGGENLRQDVRWKFGMPP